MRAAALSLVLLASAVLAPAAHVGAYPTPTDFDPDGVLDAATWEAFVGMGGFEHAPNASGDASGVDMEWNGTTGTYSVRIRTELIDRYDGGDRRRERLVTVSCLRRDGGGVVFNRTLSQTVFRDESPGGDSYDVTASVEPGGVVHVVWGRSIEVLDAPSRYWLFHESVEANGSSIVRGHLFYFETRGGYLVPLDYRPLLVGLAVSATLVILAVAYWARRRSGRKER